MSFILIHNANGELIGQTAPVHEDHADEHFNVCECCGERCFNRVCDDCQALHEVAWYTDNEYI